MTSFTYSKEGIIAWVKQTDIGQQNFSKLSPDQSVEEFLADATYVETFLGLMAHSIEYPGDGNWPGVHPSTPSDIQISELSRIIRKLLPHVSDDVPFKAKVEDYLRRKGLNGSILRNGHGEPNA